ncbi:inositol polyphosphate phosphatase [Lentinula aciculospora]|uniref:Inositol polyphosphate phosphatase n=1 Tax=Lentinula aciculospora TaxID=153920 RepID=A0A9W9APP8_9AGAR|nr:inositol polyphosphate phosphatase [Lentinula aciculospora]
MSGAIPKDQLLIQIASYNTALQGSTGLPQDLVDWLSPTLQVSSFLSHSPRGPDIVAVGFQELLPLHLGLSGASKSVIDQRSSHILSEIETHSPEKAKYSLLAKIVNVGIALLVYARDEGVAQKVCDVETSWTGCGPGFMGNKGAVGVRFRVSDDTDNETRPGETYTFVCAHLTAHQHKLQHRIADFHHIVGTLLFPGLPFSEDKSPTTMYSTSHLFFLGDLNFRLDLPKIHPMFDNAWAHISEALGEPETRESLKEFDQLFVERRKRTIFVGFREGDFWQFKCTYKHCLGAVDQYDTKRVPAWTDRIMYTTHSDSPDNLETSRIRNLLYIYIPSYTISDHKPIVSLFLLPLPPSESLGTIPTIALPDFYTPKPDSLATLKRYTGHTLDRIVGVCWWLLTLFGAGSAVVGIFNFIVGATAYKWWKTSRSPSF